MYVTEVPNRGGKPTFLLRESYREGGKVKNRTLANLTKLPANAIDRSSLLWIRNFWLSAWNTAPGSIPRSLANFRSTLDVLILPPRRSERRYPRHVKIKMSNYPRNRGRCAVSGASRVDKSLAPPSFQPVETTVESS